MKCAVYRLRSQGGALLYIGSSADPLSRLRYHENYQPWGGCIASMDVRWIGTRAEALAAEREAIAAELPEWNYNHNPVKKKTIGVFHPKFRADAPETWLAATHERVEQ